MEEYDSDSTFCSKAESILKSPRDFPASPDVLASYYSELTEGIHSAPIILNFFEGYILDNLRKTRSEPLKDDCPKGSTGSKDQPSKDVETTLPPVEKLPESSSSEGQPTDDFKAGPQNPLLDISEATIRQPVDWENKIQTTTIRRGAPCQSVDDTNSPKYHQKTSKGQSTVNQTLDIKRKATTDQPVDSDSSPKYLHETSKGTVCSPSRDNKREVTTVSRGVDSSPKHRSHTFKGAVESPSQNNKRKVTILSKGAPVVNTDSLKYRHQTSKEKTSASRDSKRLGTSVSRITSGETIDDYSSTKYSNRTSKAPVGSPSPDNKRLATIISRLAQYQPVNEDSSPTYRSQTSKGRLVDDTNIGRHSSSLDSSNVDIRQPVSYPSRSNQKKQGDSSKRLIVSESSKYSSTSCNKQPWEGDDVVDRQSENSPTKYNRRQSTTVGRVANGQLVDNDRCPKSRHLASGGQPNDDTKTGQSNSRFADVPVQPVDSPSWNKRQQVRIAPGQPVDGDRGSKFNNMKTEYINTSCRGQPIARRSNSPMDQLHTVSSFSKQTSSSSLNERVLKENQGDSDNHCKPVGKTFTNFYSQRSLIESKPTRPVACKISHKENRDPVPPKKQQRSRKVKPKSASQPDPYDRKAPPQSPNYKSEPVGRVTKKQPPVKFVKVYSQRTNRAERYKSFVKDLLAGPTEEEYLLSQKYKRNSSGIYRQPSKRKTDFHFSCKSENEYLDSSPTEDDSLGQLVDSILYSPAEDRAGLPKTSGTRSLKSSQPDEPIRPHKRKMANESYQSPKRIRTGFQFTCKSENQDTSPPAEDESVEQLINPIVYSPAKGSYRTDLRLNSDLQKPSSAYSLQGKCSEIVNAHKRKMDIQSYQSNRRRMRTDIQYPCKSEKESPSAGLRLNEPSGARCLKGNSSEIVNAHTRMMNKQSYQSPRRRMRTDIQYPCKSDSKSHRADLRLNEPFVARCLQGNSSKLNEFIHSLKRKVDNQSSYQSPRRMMRTDYQFPFKSEKTEEDSVRHVDLSCGKSDTRDPTHNSSSPAKNSYTTVSRLDSRKPGGLQAEDENSQARSLDLFPESDCFIKPKTPPDRLSQWDLSPAPASVSTSLYNLVEELGLDTDSVVMEPSERHISLSHNDVQLLSTYLNIPHEIVKNAIDYIVNSRRFQLIFK